MRILAPVKTLLGELAPVGIGNWHNVRRAVVKQPRSHGVNPIPVDQLLGKARGNLARGQLACVHRRNHHKGKLGAWAVAVRKHERVYVITRRAAGCHLVPRVAIVNPLGKSRVRGGQRRHVALRLLHCAVAAITGDRARLSAVGVEEGAHGAARRIGARTVNSNHIAQRTQLCERSLIHRRNHHAIGVIHLPDIHQRGQRIDARRCGGCNLDNRGAAVTSHLRACPLRAGDHKEERQRGKQRQS